MKNLFTFLLFLSLMVASTFGQAPAPTITDAQRIAYLKAQNAVLRKQLAAALEQAAIAKNEGPEADALKKAAADIAATCPGAQGTPDNDVVCPPKAEAKK